MERTRWRVRLTTASACEESSKEQEAKLESIAGAFQPGGEQLVEKLIAYIAALVCLHRRKLAREGEEQLAENNLTQRLCKTRATNTLSKGQVAKSESLEQDEKEKDVRQVMDEIRALGRLSRRISKPVGDERLAENKLVIRLMTARAGKALSNEQGAELERMQQEENKKDAKHVVAKIQALVHPPRRNPRPAGDEQLATERVSAKLIQRNSLSCRDAPCSRSPKLARAPWTHSLAKLQIVLKKTCSWARTGVTLAM